MTISGWGYTEKSLQISDVLMHALVPYLNQTECITKFNDLRSRISGIDFALTDTHLCAGGYDRRDTCYGDSGGPLTYPADNDAGKPRTFQHGIISAGFQCSVIQPYPGIYTRIDKFMEWILDNLSD